MFQNFMSQCLSRFFILGFATVDLIEGKLVITKVMLTKVYKTASKIGEKVILFEALQRA